MPKQKQLQSQLNVLNARVQQFEDDITLSPEQIEKFTTPIKKQILKVEAEKHGLLANNMDVDCEILNTDVDGIN